MTDSKNKILFLYNPKSGKAKIRNYLSDIIDIFTRADYQVMIHSTQGINDAKKMVINCDKKEFDFIVCCGGDGTLDEVVTGMMQCEEKLPIGYIPAGSTNDFAKSLGISNDMIIATSDIVFGKLFSCDIGRFNGDAFVYIAAFGIFTEVSYETDQHLKNSLGHMAYILKGIQSLTSIKSYKMKIEYEDKCIEDDFIYGMITNSSSVGGFKDITGSDIKLDDGVFEVTLIKKPTNPIELHNIIFSIMNKKMDANCIINFKTNHLEIESVDEINWTLDGEFGGTQKKVVIDNVNKALSIIVKK